MQERCDDAEAAGMVRLLLARGAHLIAVGHGRDDASAATADAFAQAWQACGGELAARVDWAPAGASWLRPARRLTRGQPDAWVIADTAEGFAPMARRLRESTDWDPGRTVCSGALADSRLPELAGEHTVDGIRGATRDGGVWGIAGGRLVRYDPRSELDPWTR